MVWNEYTFYLGVELNDYSNRCTAYKNAAGWCIHHFCFQLLSHCQNNEPVATAHGDCWSISVGT